MKKLILLLLFTISIYAQEFILGASIDIKAGRTLDTKFVIAKNTQWDERSLGLYETFSITGSLVLNNNAMLTAKLGYGTGPLSYKGYDLGLFYNSNNLMNNFFINAGINAHINIPSREIYLSRTLFSPHLGFGYKIIKKISLELFYEYAFPQIVTKEIPSEINHQLYYSIGLGLQIYFIK
ncbi:MAG: hypothetical protein CMF23_16330 [Ignavibacteriae bacterium]|nr:hypothetical protein [Ignavibacteriota bacterium]